LCSLSSDASTLTPGQSAEHTNVGFVCECVFSAGIDDRARPTDLLGRIGRTSSLDEEHVDAVTSAGCVTLPVGSGSGDAAVQLAGFDVESFDELGGIGTERG